MINEELEAALEAALEDLAPVTDRLSDWLRVDGARWADRTLDLSVVGAQFRLPQNGSRGLDVLYPGMDVWVHVEGPWAL